MVVVPLMAHSSGGFLHLMAALLTVVVVVLPDGCPAQHSDCQESLQCAMKSDIAFSVQD